MPVKLGIEKLKALVGLGLSVGELVAELSDGFDFGDLPEIVAAAREAKALGGAAAALQEYLDLDDAEKMEMTEFVIAEFDLKNDNIEAIVEQAVAVAIQLSDLAALLLKPKEA